MLFRCAVVIIRAISESVKHRQIAVRLLCRISGKNMSVRGKLIVIHLMSQRRLLDRIAAPCITKI